MSLIDYFPHNKEPRQIQREILRQITDGLNIGFKKFIICAPTGSGKSYIAKTITNKFDKSFIVTVRKQLQDQYTTDFTDIKSVKGESNFPCIYTMEENKVTNQDAAIKEGYTCNKELCYSYKIIDSLKTKVPCKYKPDVLDYELGIYEGQTCLYYQQKYDGLISDCSVWNYSSLFQIMQSYENFIKYLERRYCI